MEKILEVAKELLDLNENAALTWTLMLKLRGIDLLREQHDIDLIINDYVDTFIFKSDTEIESITIKIKNKAKASIYRYNDDSSSVYFANLYVSKKYRNNGIGNNLLKILEQIGESLNANNCYLLVEKESWKHNWYRSSGYSDFKEQEKFTWMEKHLKSRL